MSYSYNQPLYSVTSDAFELDETIPLEARALYRILKTRVRKDANESNRFIRPSLEWIREKTGWSSNGTVYHYLRVLEVIGLVVIIPGKREGAKNEVNKYYICDDYLLYAHDPKLKLGKDKDLYNRNVVKTLFDEKKAEGTPFETPKTTIDEEAMKIAKELHAKIIEDLPRAKTPNFTKWAQTIQKLHKRGYEYVEIQRVMRWAKADKEPRGNGFCWSINILSAQSLYDKFEKLLGASKIQTKGHLNVNVKQERYKVESE